MGVYGYLDAKGNVAIAPIFDYAEKFVGGYADIAVDSVFGYVNKKGQVKLFPQYERVGWSSWGDATDIGYAKKNGKYALMHRNGKLITDFVFEKVGRFNDGFRLVKIQGNYNYVDKKGKLVFKNENLIFSNFYPIIDSIAIILDSKKAKTNYSPREGIVNLRGEVIVPPIYDAVTGFFSNGLMKVLLNDKKGLVDRQNKLIVPVIYDNVGTYENGLISAKINGKYGVLNRNNEVLVPFEYDKISVSDNLFLVEKNGERFYINLKNEKVKSAPPKPNYKLIGGFNDGLNLMVMNNKAGYINKKGDIVIPAIYENARPFESGVSVVKKEGKWGAIDTSGKIIVPFIYKKLSPMSSSRIKFQLFESKKIP